MFQVLFSKMQSSTLFTSLVLIALAAGCGKSDNTVSVNGHVSYKGQPISLGTVTFFAEQGRPIVAPLSAEGEYEANLAPGDYVAIIMVGAEVPAGYKEGDPLPPSKLTLPPEYMNRSQSPLKATITANHSEPVDFTLQ